MSKSIRLTIDNLPEEIKENYNCIYVGHYELYCVVNKGVVAYGPTKVGRAKHLNAIFRGRNQGGAYFIIDHIYHSNNYTELERKVHKFLATYRTDHKRHKELYILEPDLIAKEIEAGMRLIPYKKEKIND